MRHPDARRTPLTFHLIFHTHWDREWYLPRAAFGARLVRVVDQLIDALEQDDGFRTFLLDGQTILLEDYLRARPEQESRVRALVRAGRLGTGPWYVLADELIPSGEALVRNLLLGSAASRRLGRRLDVLYAPDAFGHPAAWPALAAQFGIRHGVAWRGLAPEGGAGDCFRWQAPDASEVLLYHLPRDGYEIGAALPARLDTLRERWPAVRETLVSRATTSHVAVFVGADHHAHYPEPSRLRELLAGLESGHEVRISRLDEFLEAVGRERSPLPVLRGEQRDSYGYTWALQGVHGTRLPLKRLNARVELLLERWAEPLAALAQRNGGRKRHPLLSLAWQSVVQSQFHDAIAGCTDDRVADEARGRFIDAAATAREVVRSSIDDLCRHDPDLLTVDEASTLVVWNPIARRRGGVVIADVTFFRRDVLVGPPGTRIAQSGGGFAPFVLTDPAGVEMPVQVIGVRRALERRDAWRRYPDLDEVDAVRIAFELPAAAGLSLTRLIPVAVSAPRTPAGRVTAGHGRLCNGLIEVHVAGDGTFSLRDLRTGASFGRLFSLESEVDGGDTYSFQRGAENVTRARPRVRRRLHAAGPVVGILAATWDALDARFGLEVELRSGEPFARLSLTIVNRGVDRRLRARLPLGVPGVPVIAGAAFGSERRDAGAPARDSPAESPVPTAPAHRFVGAAGAAAGLALLVPGHCEYEWRSDGDLLLTLLRSVGQLSRGDLGARAGHAGWPVPVPGAQCLGCDRLTLALAPLAGGVPDPGRLEALWEAVFLPPAGRWMRGAGALQPWSGSVELAGDGLVVSAIKPAEEGRGVILRCWNASAASVEGAWTVRPSPIRAARVRADEAGGEPIPIGGGGTIRFTAASRAIVTIRIEDS